ncbi:MAG: ABC transporter ATP-binding protein [Pseudomonadota bacterium]
MTAAPATDTPGNGIAMVCRNLCKRYGEIVAVTDLSLDIRAGTCFGLLGPNGAGKSTTLEMLQGLRAPDTGEVHYRGRPLGEDFKLRHGTQFQSTALIDFQTTREMLELFAAFYPTSRSIDELVARLNLGPFLDQQAMKLSGGQRQRLLLALSLVNDPEIVFLDEPTTGLDPQARRNLWDLVRDIKAEGKTIVLTTHYMEEAEYLCDELAIMDHGRVIATGTPRSLLRDHFGDTVIRLDAAAGSTKTLAAACPGTEVFADGAHQFVATNDVPRTLSQLTAAGIDLASLEVKPRSLEDLFLKLTGRALRE